MAVGQNDASVVAAEPGYEPGRTLPAAWYTEPSWLEVELERIFERSWQYVGWLGNLESPGSFVTTTLGRIPVVVVRGEDGELRALVNVCRHRGSVVVPEECGSRKTFQCRYQAWTYNLDGTLRKAPRLDTAASTGESKCAKTSSSSTPFSERTSPSANPCNADCVPGDWIVVGSSIPKSSSTASCGRSRAP